VKCVSASAAPVGLPECPACLLESFCMLRLSGLSASCEEWHARVGQWHARSGQWHARVGQGGAVPQGPWMLGGAGMKAAAAARCLGSRLWQHPLVKATQGDADILLAFECLLPGNTSCSKASFCYTHLQFELHGRRYGPRLLPRCRRSCRHEPSALPCAQQPQHHPESRRPRCRSSPLSKRTGSGEVQRACLQANGRGAPQPLIA